MSLPPYALLCLLLVTGLTGGCEFSTAPSTADLSSHEASAPQDRFVTPVAFNEIAGSQTTSSEPAESTGTEAPVLPGALATPANAPSPASTAPEETSPAEASDANTNVKPDETFHPPFGERTDLFSPPQTQVPYATGPEDAAQPLSIPSVNVSLKGFARVSDLRVLLMIEDSIAPLGLGQEKQGIRVVAIDPPHVTLARDEQQWTLTLSNQIGNSRDPRMPHRTISD